jgi:hypothetical protein
MVLRPCLDCGEPSPNTRCPAHTRTTAERGYGAEHQRARARLARQLPAPCGYGCGRMLYPDTDWVAAHVLDGRPESGWTASCRSCNERAKAANRPLIET